MKQKLSVKRMMRRIRNGLKNPAGYALVKQDKYAFCDYCDEIISGWMGGVGGADEGYVITRKCFACCDKENEGIEHRWENKDEHAQIIEYNGYRNGEKVGGVSIAYFTTEQIDYIEQIKEKMRNGIMIPPTPTRRVLTEKTINVVQLKVQKARF